MGARRLLSLAASAAVALVLVSLLAGALLGQPILLSYVETGSMQPTMDPGDGFVAIPTAIGGDVSEGDVIVFQAEHLHGGGLTTHRVVAETDRGYVTRGDANPFTDQDGEEPPVKDAQVVAKALTVGDSVLVIPYLGTVVMSIQDALEWTQLRLAQTLGMRSLLGSQGVAMVLFGLSVVGYVLDWYLTDPAAEKRQRSRSRDDGTSLRLVLAGLALLVVVAATAAMVVPAGTQEFGVVSAEFESENPTVIEQGTTSDLPYRVANAGLVPVHVYLEPASEGVAVTPRHLVVDGQSRTNATLTLAAADDTGYYRRFLTQHRYLAVLPGPVIDGLYRVHPWLPLVAIDGLLGSTVYLAGAVTLKQGRLRNRERENPGRSVTERVLGWF
ncbi:signal peptidase I [Haloarchaeobius amylolyticus]|uniref:signal peptidase I n=1 Tax=Haloarchaeobius amylolyticus TaxID=1198296 RepID=UPI0022704D0D|nr:signal peptidase I [Haloarchaeobius amylolyticus]